VQHTQRHRLAFGTRNLRHRSRVRRLAGCRQQDTDHTTEVSAIEVALLFIIGARNTVYLETFLKFLLRRCILFKIYESILIPTIMRRYITLKSRNAYFIVFPNLRDCTNVLLINRQKIKSTKYTKEIPFENIEHWRTMIIYYILNHTSQLTIIFFYKY